MKTLKSHFHEFHLKKKEKNIYPLSEVTPSGHKIQYQHSKETSNESLETSFRDSFPKRKIQL